VRNQGQPFRVPVQFAPTGDIPHPGPKEIHGALKFMGPVFSRCDCEIPRIDLKSDSLDLNGPPGMAPVMRGLVRLPVRMMETRVQARYRTWSRMKRGTTRAGSESAVVRMFGPSQVGQMPGASD
jgi:hypothetical protein